MKRLQELRSGLSLGESILQGLNRLRKNHLEKKKTIPQRLL